MDDVVHYVREDKRGKVHLPRTQAGFNVDEVLKAHVTQVANHLDLPTRFIDVGIEVDSVVERKISSINQEDKGSGKEASLGLCRGSVVIIDKSERDKEIFVN